MPLPATRARRWGTCGGARTRARRRRIRLPAGGRPTEFATGLDYAAGGTPEPCDGRERGITETSPST